MCKESCVQWVIPEKIHTPTTEGILENLMGGGVNGSGNPDGWEGSEPKNTSSGVTFNFIDVSIALIDKFSNNCFTPSNFIILSNYGPLNTFILSFHRLALIYTLVEATCDNWKISRKIA